MFRSSVLGIVAAAGVFVAVLPAAPAAAAAEAPTNASTTPCAQWGFDGPTHIDFADAEIAFTAHGANVDAPATFTSQDPKQTAPGKITGAVTGSQLNLVFKTRDPDLGPFTITGSVLPSGVIVGSVESAGEDDGAIVGLQALTCVDG